MASPSWDHCRSFLAVLRQGSLSAAARELGLTQPTLGRHIADIEEALGAALFVRSQAGLAPTETARLLTPHAEAMEVAAAAMTRAASAGPDEARGVVRVTASDVIGVEVLPSILAEFRAQNPRIAIELSLSNTNQDLSRRDADIAVRMARPTQSALVVKLLGRVGISLYAHASYLAHAGRPRSSADLAQHALIGFDRDAWSLRFFRLKNLPVGREIFALRTDSDHAQLAALRSGFGIGGCQDGIARRDPELVPVLPDAFRFELEMWLVMHEDLRQARRVRLLYDHLAKHLRHYIEEGARRAPSTAAPRHKRGRAVPAKAAKSLRKNSRGRG